MDGIEYELQQNELLGEIEKDVSMFLKNEEEKGGSTKVSTKGSSKTDKDPRTNLELELAFAFSPTPE
jgi:hypothetical protein